MSDLISPYSDELGSAHAEPGEPLEIGSWASYSLSYRAGRYGIDDGGGLRVLFRLATDQTPPQFDDPEAPGYTSVEVSGDFQARPSYSPHGFQRPYIKGIEIGITNGYMREGDEITLRFGDRRQGSPGMRMQTFAEHRFELLVLANPFATRNYLPLPKQPSLTMRAGPPVHWRAVLPSARRVGDSFRLGLRCEDSWGNPSDRMTDSVRLSSSLKVRGLPESTRIEDGGFSQLLDGLSVEAPGVLEIELSNQAGALLARSNPLLITDQAAPRHFWGDMHGQSAETVGTNRAGDYFAFARDLAFLDATSHQANDFQVSGEFWAEINQLCETFDEAGSFVAIPGYEWSGNTGMGGDRNVYFAKAGETLRRSSHAMIADHSDIENDCNDADELFAALLGRDAVVNAHVGGRYADMRLFHDGRVEKSVEIHSAWGSFEWILMDALEMGHRVGVVANSDGHKGRPGASHPGASMFGAYGGLTCFQAEELSRDAIFECWRRRHHYATTGARLYLDFRARFDEAGLLFAADPALGEAESRPAREIIMGDIFRPSSDPASDRVTLALRVIGSAPLLRVDIFDGPRLVETFRPYSEGDLGRRIRITWEGARVRGRSRALSWDGNAKLTDNAFEAPGAINFWNPDRPLRGDNPAHLAWQSITTGNFAGFQARLKDPRAGRLEIDTAPVKTALDVAEIGFEDLFFPAEGLGAGLRACRLPDAETPREMAFEITLPRDAGREARLFARVTQMDGHQAWSSPIYVLPEA